MLRPFRLISQLEGLRDTVELLLQAMPRVLDVLLVSFLLLDVSAILAVQVFGGKFGRCVSPSSLITRPPLGSGAYGTASHSAALPFATRAACEAAGYAWANPPFGNFDNVGHAMLLLFEMASLEGWTDVLFAGIDAVGVSEAPVRDHAPSQALFSIVWILVGSLCLLNLIVGVLMSTFHDIKRREEEGSELGLVMTEKQRAWVDVVSQLLAVVKPRARAPCPTHPWRAACHRLATWARFESVMLVVIVFNTCLMALDGFGLSKAMEDLLGALTLGCTVLFILEAVIKLLGLGPKLYFSSAWNLLDFGIVLLAIAELLLTWVATTGAEANPSVIRALRMVRLLRVLRTLRVVRMARGLRMLLMMLLYALPTLGNICGLYLIVNCVYALLAMQLFGNVSLDLSVAAGERPGTRAHFCTFGDAFLTLFECATGESWTALMHDQARSTWLAIPFFISYVILSTFIIFKMCIVLIIENFNLALKRDRHGLQPESADVFQDVWSQFDPEATGRMHVEYLIDFLRLLPPPLGLEPSEYPAGYVSAADVTRYAYMMDVRPRVRPRAGPTEDRRGGTWQPYVAFAEVLAVLAKDSYKDAGEADLERSLGGTLHRTRRTSGSAGRARRAVAWQEVLPAPSSKLGSELLDRLVAADVLSAEHAEQLRLAHQRHAADPASFPHARVTIDSEEEHLRHSLACAAIARSARRWQERRVAAGVALRAKARLRCRFEDGMLEQVTQARQAQWRAYEQTQAPKGGTVLV
jgi:hypothetical protein